MSATPAGGVALLMRAGSRVCGVPLAHVVETMRPLPIEPVVGAPLFVKGLAVIRSRPVPVVDLAAALGASIGTEGSRFVTLRLGERTLALLVDEVRGITQLDSRAVGKMPSIVSGSRAEMITAIGALDSELLMILQATSILSDETWHQLDEAASAR